MSKIAKQLRELSASELAAKIITLKSELIDQQKALAMNELPNPHVVRGTRRQVAVAKTLTREAQSVKSSPVENKQENKETAS
ncbi:MAG TPA: 50S ribosomal protein L29 [Patescibacteria group bacterium]|jgi:ribosomal protein L29|nr:50S ribosomal protein L29 [Patescibacteria group bacterium]